MDQNGPRVRVRKIVRWPATDSFRYIQRLDVRTVEVKYALAQIETGKRGHHPDDASTVEIPSTRRMFHASGLSL